MSVVIIRTSDGNYTVGEGTTPTIEVTFTDEAGDEVTPTAVTWSLSDVNGNIINERENVEVSTITSATVSITLSTVDTALSGTETDYDDYKRYISIRGVYNSSYGNGLVAIKEGMFTIDNFRSR
jgi:hypothetical protein